MKLSLPFIQLPLMFDAPTLAREIDALGESVWMPHPQGFPGNSMLPLIAIDGDPANESYAGEMRPTPHLQRCPYLMKSMEALGATLGRSRLMRLSGHAEVTRHADQGYYWLDRVRVHVPIRTQPTVRFECGDAHVNMAAGECWIFDTWRQHRVLNDAVEARIHLVVDTVGGDRFWNAVSAGRSHDGRALSGTWSPRQVVPGTAQAPLVLERANVPCVMTPWELTSRLGFLMSEAEAHPNLEPLQALSARFLRQWQALWAAHGEHASGWPEYRAALETYMQQAGNLAQPMVLRNELALAHALGAQVGKMAVKQAAAKHAAAAPPSPVPAMSAITPAQAPRVAAVAATPAVRETSEFDQPVFVVSSPRSGSTMLFEALARAPGVYTIGGESHTLIETMPQLHPATNGMRSNRVTESAAVPAVVEELRARFRARMVDRDGQAPVTAGFRMLEKTPKNSLRVPFLSRTFPGSHFIYLYRDPRDTLGSMIDAWQSGRFRTYPDLPGWQGLPWSLLLIPDWQALVGRPLAEIVATQWETATRLMLDDLEKLPAGRVHTVCYEALVIDFNAELRRLCEAVGFEWDARVAQPPPLSRYTLTPPSPGKWRRHADQIEPLLPRLSATMERAARFAGAAAAWTQARAASA